MYEKAISLRPEYLEAYNNLGTVHRETGDVEEAMVMFGKVAEISPNFPRFITILLLQIMTPGIWRRQ